MRTSPDWSNRARLASLIGLLAPFALTAFVIGNVGYVTELYETRSFAGGLAGTEEIFFDPSVDGVWFFVIDFAFWALLGGMIGRTLAQSVRLLTRPQI